MIQAQSVQRRPWPGIAWLIVVVVTGALVAAVNVYAGALLIALAALVVAAFVLSVARAAPRARLARFAGTPMVQRTIYTADGAERPALVLPIDGAEDYQAVLTSDGYVLVDTAGQVVYTLKR